MRRGLKGVAPQCPRYYGDNRNLQATKWCEITHFTAAFVTSYSQAKFIFVNVYDTYITNDL